MFRFLGIIIIGSMLIVHIVNQIFIKLINHLDKNLWI